MSETFTIIVPPAFADDHWSGRNCLGHERYTTWSATSRGVKAVLDRAETDDLYSDAIHYSDCGSSGWETGPFYLGLGRSARATVKRILAAGYRP